MFRDLGCRGFMQNSPAFIAKERHRCKQHSGGELHSAFPAWSFPVNTPDADTDHMAATWAKI